MAKVKQGEVKMQELRNSMILSSEQKIAYGNMPLPSETFQVTRVKDEQKFHY